MRQHIRNESDLDTLMMDMTIEEKVGQLSQISPSIFGAFGKTMDETIVMLVEGQITPEEFGKLERDYHEDDIRAGLIGSMGGIHGAEMANALQRIAVEESRLGIPMLFGLDVIHGFRTVFPIPLAESCSWEPELARRTAEAAASEASAAGLHWTFAPMVDVARDARWGRVAEGAGEDPLLGSRMAYARVKGFQGDNLRDHQHILACAKHFAAYGAAEAGRDYNTVDMSLGKLHDVYLPPFQAAVDAGCATLMSAFNDLNGVPCTTNAYLLRDVLRKQFAFDGFVVSDANSVAECAIHGYAEDNVDAAIKAVLAGLDIDMSHGTFRDGLINAVQEGRLQIEAVNEAVLRVLRIKMRMGLFEEPYRTTTERETSAMMTTEHLALAREAAAKSIVLLQNKHKTLPLSLDTGMIAVVGPLADDAGNLLGSWSGVGESKDVVTVLNGLRAAIGEGRIVHAVGCDIQDPHKKDEQKAIERIAAAVEVASIADTIVAVVGESSDMSGEAGSRMDLVLPGKQLDLLKALHATGKPLVVVLVNGRPLALPWVKENASAIVELWQPGLQGGHALADVLFGKVNPSGKITATFPYSVGQEPLYYAHPTTGRPAGKIKFTSKYVDGPVEPLFPFGYGLSYTTFSYSDLIILQDTLPLDGTLKVQVKVSNSGQIAGDEIIQLYISDPVASQVRPVRELKDFAKVYLAPGEEKCVHFTIPVSKLGYHDQHGKYAVEPGEFRVFVGTDVQADLSATFYVNA